jgi:hypothetical protein
LNVRAAACRISVQIKDTSGVSFTLCQFNSASLDNLQILGGGEAKFDNCTFLGATRYQGLIRGGLVSTPVECYFTQCTFTVGNGFRSFPIQSVADNGSGKARLFLGTVSPVASAADRGCRFWGFAEEPVQAVVRSVTASGSATLSTLTAIYGGGAVVNLIAGPVTLSASAATNATAIAAAINANTATSKFSAAATSRAEIVVYADESIRADAQWAILGWTTTGTATVSPQTLTAIARVDSHGLAQSDFVQVGGTNSAYDGV